MTVWDRHHPERFAVFSNEMVECVAAVGGALAAHMIAKILREARDNARP